MTEEYDGEINQRCGRVVAVDQRVLAHVFPAGGKLQQDVTGRVDVERVAQQKPFGRIGIECQLMGSVGSLHATDLHEKLGRLVEHLGQTQLLLLDELQRRGIAVWLRHVVVPGLTDDDAALDALVDFLRPYTVIQKIEWLPYHTMGVFKYEELGLDYPLKGVEPLSAERIREIRERYRDVFPVKK